MKSYEKEPIDAQLKDEQKALDDLEKAYKQARKTCQQKLKDLNSRTDMQNLQSIIHQKKYQEQLLKQIDGVLNDLQTHTYKTSNEFFQSSYENGYIGSMYEFQKQGIPLTIPISKKKMVTAIQTDSKLSSSYYLKQGLTVQNIRTLKKQVALEATRGIASGQSWLEVAESLSIQRYFTISQNDAMRIVRTEGNRINQQGRLDAGDEAVQNGCDLLKQWDATLDSRTREAHREADGQIVEWDEDFTVMGEKLKAPSIGGSAKNVINCRCQLLKRPRWALDEDELKVLQERAEFYSLDKSKSFEDYKDKFLNLPDVPVQIQEIQKNGQSSFEDQMKVIQDRVKQKGYATEEDLHEAGDLVRKELKFGEKTKEAEKRYNELLEIKRSLYEQVNQYQKQIDKLTKGKMFDPYLALMTGSGYKNVTPEQQEEIQRLQKLIEKIKTSDEWQNCISEIFKIEKECNFTGDRSIEDLFNVLSRIRPMGHPNAKNGVLPSRSPVRASVLKALEHYPTSWIEKSFKAPIEVRKGTRGYSLGNLIVISGWDDDDMTETAFHELGHYFEHRVMTGQVSQIKGMWRNNKTDESAKAIYMAESLFYDRRTAGENLTWLGKGYKRDEKTRKDDFVHPYMGKDYGGNDFELVSMGFQYAYTNPKKLAEDPDMESWIYGILALYE